ncbi:hypothetical protein [Paenibacillus sp. J2TS4]|uniref:hypothetical protein n=1 Tax=Paenibacillus sp. J2TS4 TaxID=2807194 RepID=UPI001BD04AEA|nr:hypothetical protein [Paenibacillus sp. J2TS4]
MDVTTDLQDVSISGSGKIIGGRYNKIKISGSGKISGEVEANRLKISGSGKVEGPAVIKELQVSGHCGFDDSLEGESCTVSGSFHSRGNVHMSQLKVSGSFSCSQSVKLVDAQINGYFKADKLEAEEFRLEGSMNISKELNAHVTDVILYGPCRVHEIGGETISIYSHHSRPGLFRALLSLFKSDHSLTANLIEGTQVYLENTRANVVRGGRVTIGPGCRIEQVEYMDALDVSPEAQVGNAIKI